VPYLAARHFFDGIESRSSAGHKILVKILFLITSLGEVAVDEQSACTSPSKLTILQTTAV
jgi:hypothetical protein